MFGWKAKARSKAQARDTNTATQKIVEEATKSRDPSEHIAAEEALINGGFAFMIMTVKSLDRDLAEKLENACEDMKTLEKSVTTAKALTASNFWIGLTGGSGLDSSECAAIIRKVGRTVRHYWPELTSGSLCDLTGQAHRVHMQYVDRIVSLE